MSFWLPAKHPIPVLGPYGPAARFPISVDRAFTCALRLPGGALDGARAASPFPRLVFASACGRSPRRHYASCVHSRETIARWKVVVA